MGSRRTLIDTTHVEAERWGPLQVDADWRAFCQAMYQGIEGKRMGNVVLLLQGFAPGGGNSEAWGESEGKGSTGHEKDRENNFMTQPITKTFQEEPKPDWDCGKNT